MIPKQALGFMLLAGAAAAQSGLQGPTVGLMLDDVGRLRTLNGIRANFLPGEILAEDVRDVAAWGDAALVHSGAGVRVYYGGVFSTRTPALEGPAILGLDFVGRPAVAAFPQEGAMLLRRRRSWVSARLDIDGRLLAIAAHDPASVMLALRRSSGFWLQQIAWRTGAVLHQERIAEDAGAAAILPGGCVLYHAAGALVLRRSGGQEARLPLDGVVAALDPVGAGWVQVRIAGGAAAEAERPLILHIGDEGLVLYELPGGGR